MLTKRQQQRLIAMYDLSPERGFICFVGTYFRVLIDQGFVGMEYPHDWAVGFAHLTPPGQRLATILAELPAPLTRRQWQILLRFRDVGTTGTLTIEPRTCVRFINWYLPTEDSTISTTSERTMRILCDYGLIGFEYRGYVLTRFAHLTPLGEELVSLLP